MNIWAGLRIVADVGAARDVAWEVAAAILGVLCALVLVEGARLHIQTPDQQLLAAPYYIIYFT